PAPRRPRLPSKVPRDRRPVAVPRIPRAPGRMSGSLEPYGALVGVGDPPGRGGARRRGHALWPAPGEPVPARRDRREDRGPRRKGAPEAARGGPGPPDGLDASGRDGGDLHAQRGGGRPARRRGRYAHAGASRLRPLFFFQAEDGIRDATVTGVQTCALPISISPAITSKRLLTASTSLL